MVKCKKYTRKTQFERKTTIEYMIVKTDKIHTKGNTLERQREYTENEEVQ